MPKPKLDLKEILLPTLSLFLICLIITGALAGVNAITKDPIAKNETLVADAARQQIFPGARFEEKKSYFAAFAQNGTPLGYCIDAAAQGYGGEIKITVGLDTQGVIKLVQVLGCDNETPGLGQKIKEEGFLSQFLGGKDKIDTVDSIASATYSSVGVQDAINIALNVYETQIKGGAAR